MDLGLFVFLFFVVVVVVVVVVVFLTSRFIHCYFEHVILSVSVCYITGATLKVYFLCFLVSFIQS